MGKHYFAALYAQYCPSGALQNRIEYEKNAEYVV